MGRTCAIFPIALACSLAVHSAITGLYVKFGKYLLSPTASTSRTPEMVIRVDPELLDFGDAAGRGIGSNSSKGDEPMRATEADENQALLDREPTGLGRLRDSQSKLIGPPGDSTAGAVAIATPLPAPTLPPRADDPLPPATITPPNAAALPLPAPQVRISQPQPNADPEVVKTSPQAPPRQTQVAAALQPSSPGVPTSAGKPLPQSESDSDPFARIGSVVFHNGRLDVQLGRHVKTVRPQLGIAGETDLLGLTLPIVMLQVHIEPSGRVSNVEIVRSSGSIAVDEPTRNAVYQWEFEPARDKQGHPIRDVVSFTIEYR